MQTLDHKTDPIKLWRTIKAIDGRSTPKAENEAITFDKTFQRTTNCTVIQSSRYRVYICYRRSGSLFYIPREEVIVSEQLR